MPRIMILGHNAQQTALLKDVIEGRFGLPCDTAPLDLRPRQTAAPRLMEPADAPRDATTRPESMPPAAAGRGGRGGGVKSFDFT